LNPARTGFSKLSLATRTILVAGILVAVCGVAVDWLIVETNREAYLADRGASLGNRVQQTATRLDVSVDSIRRNVLVLAHLPPVQGILRAARNGGIDPEHNIPIEFWAARLREIFSSFAESNPDFFQIRYIGIAAAGRELVRVEARDGRVMVTPPEKLQSKGDRDYFQATLKLRAGEVYLSEIDLNRELGKIQIPHVRTLRAATPVFTPDGDMFGMIVINADVGPLIDVLTTNLPPGIQGYLMNGEGDYLAHPDPSRTFGFDQGKRYTWQEDMPGLQPPSTQGGEQQLLQTLSTREGVLHVAVARVQFDPRLPEHFLLAAYALPDSRVEARMADVRNMTAAGTAGIALLLFGTVVVFVRRAFAPLKRLTALAETIGQGRYDVALPDEAGGELGTFVRAFGGMLKRIGEREQTIRQADADLQRNEARLQTIVENLAEGVAVSDLDGRLLHFNRAAIQMHGFAGLDEYLRLLPEFAGIFELSAPDGTLWPVEQWPLARILRGENLHDLEVHIRRKHNGWKRVFSYGGSLARSRRGRAAPDGGRDNARRHPAHGGGANDPGTEAACRDAAGSNPRSRGDRGPRGPDCRCQRADRSGIRL
jgi:PAS domain-containing protein